MLLRGNRTVLVNAGRETLGDVGVDGESQADGPKEEENDRKLHGMLIGCEDSRFSEEANSMV